mmetsp:Transcript_70856/g.224308  ORF Transcript_70856/g.224308 Transcript_70856/m.224308 type:complete len:887 (+) Transcript_70856:97-2757(+)
MDRGAVTVALDSVGALAPPGGPDEECGWNIHGDDAPLVSDASGSFRSRRLARTETMRVGRLGIFSSPDVEREYACEGMRDRSLMAVASFGCCINIVYFGASAVAALLQGSDSPIVTSMGPAGILTATAAWSAVALAISLFRVRYINMHPGGGRWNFPGPSTPLLTCHLFWALLIYPVYGLRLWGHIAALSNQLRSRYEGGDANALFMTNLMSFIMFYYVGFTGVLVYIRTPVKVLIPPLLLGAPSYLISNLVAGVTFEAQSSTGMLLVQLLLAGLAWGMSVVRLMQWRNVRLDADALAEMEQLYRAKHLLESQVAKQRTATLAHLAHDIGTPLNAMVLANQSLQGIIERAPADIAEDAQLPQDALDASLSAIRILRKTIMDYVCNNEVEEEPQVDVVDVEVTLVKRIMPILRQMLEVHGAAQAVAELEVAGDVKGLQVLTDPSWMVDMILNYVGNAVKYTHRGHIKIAAAIRRKGDPPLRDGVGAIPADAASSAHARATEELVFSVEDTGKGISALDAASLFRPFVQVKGTVGGTGLGLTSVLRKAEKLGGSAGVVPRNAFGGCTFWFSMALKEPSALHGLGRMQRARRVTEIRRAGFCGSNPATPRSTAAALLFPDVRQATGNLAGDKWPVESPERASKEGEPGKPGQSLTNISSIPRSEIRILIVDDSSIITLLSSRQVKVAGMPNVKTAASAEEALQLLSSLGPDELPHVIATDDEMPGKSGVDLAVEVRRMEKKIGVELQCLIYLCTGNAPSMVRARDPRADEAIDGIYEKPVDITDLLGGICSSEESDPVGICSREASESQPGVAVGHGVDHLEQFLVMRPGFTDTGSAGGAVPRGLAQREGADGVLGAGPGPAHSVMDSAVGTALPGLAQSRGADEASQA